MPNQRRIAAILALLILVCATAVLAAPQLTMIDFTGVAPSGVTLDEIWGATGVDTQGRVYMAASSRYGTPPGDVGIFRYTPSTGQKEFLTTLRTVSQQQGNLQPNERIAKVHTHMLTMDGKLYFGSHDFHGGEDPATIRGGHLYSYDPASNTWEDLSKGDPGGVSAPHEGIIGLDVIPGTNKLGGLTYPQGHVLIFDLTTKRSTLYNAPAAFSQVARTPFGTSLGTLYVTYLPAGPPWSFPVWAVNPTTGAMQHTASGATVRDGMLHRAAHTRDEQTVYLKDELGGLYRWEVSGQKLTPLGSAMPDGSDAASLDATLALSNDEKVLFSFPGEQDTLYQHALGTSAKSAVARFQHVQVPTGGVVDQEGSLYFGNHTYEKNGATLLRITGVSSSPPATPTTPGPPQTGVLPAPTGLRILSPVAAQ